MTTKRHLISCFGPLRVITRDGEDITPKSAKARGVIALLAEDATARRSRRWIEARLWSDRDPKQASGSLRQALSEIRKAFGSERDALQSDRLDIWLDTRLIESELTDQTDAREGHYREIFEGLDIRDPEFEDWLRTLRSREEASAQPRSDASSTPVIQRGIRVFTRIGAHTTPAGQFAAGLICDQVGRNIEDSINAHRAGRRQDVGDIEIEGTLSEDRGSTMIVLRILHLASDQVLFSGFRRVVDETGPIMSDELMAEFSHEAARRTVGRLPQVAGLDRPEIRASGFAEIAKNRLFSYEPEKLASTDALLTQAFEADQNGLYLGWKAFQRTTQLIEGLADNTSALREETEDLISRAEELSPENGQLHALVSLVRLLFFDDANAGLVAAERALRRNPNGLFVRQCLAMAAGASGDSETAYRLSSFCRPGVWTEDARHLWDLYHGLVCITTGRLDEAHTALEGAIRACPNFKAPHRQLIALHSRMDQPQKALAHVEALKRLEPDFTLDRYLRDPDYPVTTLRSAGLLGDVKSVLGVG